MKDSETRRCLAASGIEKFKCSNEILVVIGKPLVDRGFLIFTRLHMTQLTFDRIKLDTCKPFGLRADIQEVFAPKNARIGVAFFLTYRSP